MYPNQPKARTLAIRYLALAAVCGLAVLAAYWVATHSYISVRSAGGTVQVYSQTEKRTTDITLQNGSLKKLVRRGTYELSVKSADGTGFAVLKASGFLTTAQATVALKPEAQRSFVGNNPGYCMVYAGGVLVSNACGGSYDQQATHVAATATTPTYSATDPDETGIIEGLALYKGGIVTVAQTLFTPTSDDASHVVFTLSPRPNQAVGQMAKTKLNELDPTLTYTFSEYNGGLLAYSADFKNFKLFNNLDSSPSTLRITQPSDTLVTPASVDTSDQDLIVVFSNITKTQARRTIKPKSVVSIVHGQQITTHTYKKAYSKAATCGAKKLCALHGSTLDVYKSDGTSTDYMYSLFNVRDIIGGSSPVVVNDFGLLLFDAENKSGHYIYSFENYRFNNAQRNNQDYLVSVSGADNTKAALLIEPLKQNTDSIDKKIYSLQKSEGVDKASAYGRNIYIVPKRGSLVYNAATKTSEYDPAITQASTNAIQASLQKLGIGSDYTVSGL